MAIPTIDPNLLRAYQEEIAKRTSPSTARRKSASLKRFFGWAEKEGHIEENPFSASVVVQKDQTRKILTFSNFLKIGGVVALIILIFLLAWRLRTAIPFIRVPAEEVTQVPELPTSTPRAVGQRTPAPLPSAEPTPIPLPSTFTEVDPIFGQVYKDGVLTLDGIAPTLRGIGGLLITSGSDIVINPNRNTIATGNLNLSSGNLQIAGVTRLNNLGRLASITGYYQDSGLFEIDQGAPDYTEIDKILTSSTGVATNDTLILKLDESALSSGSVRDTLVVTRKGETSGGYAIYVPDGAVYLADDLSGINGVSYSWPSSQGASSSFLQNNGAGSLSWGTIGGSGITADSLDFTEFKDAMTLDANLTISASASNYSINIDSDTFYLDTANNRVGIGTNSPETTFHMVGNHAFFEESSGGDVLRIDPNTAGLGVGIDSENSAGSAYQPLSIDASKIILETASSGNVGIADTTPDAKLEVLSTTEQLRLTNVDDTTDCRFTVSSTGDLTVDCLGSGTTEQLILATGDTINIGGSGSTDVAYNVIGNTTASAHVRMNSDDDLFIEGDLNIIGNTFPSHVIPRLDDAYTLGDSSTNWDQLYTNQILSNGTTDLFIDSGSGYILFEDGDVFHIGRATTGSEAYNFIGDSTTGASASMNSDDDLYIEGDLEVDGTIIGNTTFSCTDCIDFDDITDTMALDASTSITADGSEVLSITNTGTGNSFLVEDQASDTTPFVIDASGNVGIGTTTPSALFQIDGSSGDFVMNSTGYVTAQLNMANDIVPTSDASRSLGSSLLGWFAVYTNEIDSTGTSDLTLISAGTNIDIGSSDTLRLNNSGTDITTGTNQNLVISPNGSGTVGIGAAPGAGMELDVAGQIQLDLAGTQTSVALCGSHASGTGASVANVEIVDCTGSPGADYMEMYPTIGGLAAGDVVVPGNSFTSTLNGQRIARLTKSTLAYQGQMVGIVSNPEEAGDFNSIGYNIRSEDNPLPVALNGRVLVKVSTENGAINPGDPLTSSSIPGVAMKATKAGPIIGKALESYEGDPNSVSKVLTFVNVSWWEPDAQLTSTGDLQIVASTKNNSHTTYYLLQATGEAIDRFAAFADLIVANLKAGAIEATKLVSPVVETKLISPIADQKDVHIRIGQNSSEDGKLAIENRDGQEVASFDEAGNAHLQGELSARQVKADEISRTSGMSLGQIEELLRKVETDQKLVNQLTSEPVNQVTSKLYVTDQAAINSLSISTSLALGTDLVLSSINSLKSGAQAVNSVNSLTFPLSLQSLALAPLEIMAGKIRVETNGDVKIDGNLYVAGKIASKEANFEQVTIDKLVIANPQDSVGSVKIPAGSSEVTINNPSVTDTSLVYVTPTSTTNNNVLFVKSKEIGSFEVGFINPLDIDVTFNWWVVEVK